MHGIPRLSWDTAVATAGAPERAALRELLLQRRLHAMVDWRWHLWWHPIIPRRRGLAIVWRGRLVVIGLVVHVGVAAHIVRVSSVVSESVVKSVVVLSLELEGIASARHVVVGRAVEVIGIVRPNHLEHQLPVGKASNKTNDLFSRPVCHGLIVDSNDHILLLHTRHRGGAAGLNELHGQSEKFLGHPLELQIDLHPVAAS
mmetsp:Transcript_66039/g.155987  ORF Transcript_66039/g.155987 Transcript_66039/m.155987 type:complete len:201 (+) Transcript_66039:1145-1747(+)